MVGLDNVAEIRGSKRFASKYVSNVSLVSSLIAGAILSLERVVSCCLERKVVVKRRDPDGTYGRGSSWSLLVVT